MNFIFTSSHLHFAFWWFFILLYILIKNHCVPFEFCEPFIFTYRVGPLKQSRSSTQNRPPWFYSSPERTNQTLVLDTSLFCVAPIRVGRSFSWLQYATSPLNAAISNTLHLWGSAVAHGGEWSSRIHKVAGSIPALPNRRNVLEQDTEPLVAPRALHCSQLLLNN